MKFQTTCCYITDLCLPFLINCISVYIGDLLLFLSHVHCWAPTVKLDFQVGEDAAGESQGTAERKLRLQVKQLLASDTHYSILLYVPHKGEQPNFQDQAENCVNSGKSQGDCYCEQAKVRSHYLEEGMSQPIPAQLL